MKKRNLFCGIISLAIAASLLLTGCDGAGGTAGNGSNRPFNGTTNNGSNTSDSSNSDNDSANKESTAANASKFEQALTDAYTLPSTFDGWHLIIDDYDGDGRQEAFAFAGIPQGWCWENISIFYLDPNAKITELKVNSHQSGGPQETTSTSNSNFSDSCFRYKNEKFVVFQLFSTNTAGDDFTSIVYGVHNGSVTKKQIAGSGVEKVPEGFICASGLDVQYAYVVKNGKLVDLFSTSDAYKYVDPDYSMKTTSLKQAWKEYTKNTSAGNKEYFLQYDFDGDGRQEAYAIRGYSADGTGYLQYPEICYIGWGGTVLRISEGQNGQLYKVNQFGYKQDDSIIYAGNQKFVSWQIPGAGHAATRLFGARNGVPYEPQISGNVSYFYQDSSGRYFAEGDEKYVDDEYYFNSSTGEFHKR